jgi:hypothetical protein
MSRQGKTNASNFQGFSRFFKATKRRVKDRQAVAKRGSLQLDTLVPVVMCCALLWWVSRGMNWTTRLTVTAITLAIIIVILLVERSGF